MMRDSVLGLPSIISYPALCLCGHSEWIQGFNQHEIEYQKNTRSRYFCTACSLGPAVEFSKEAESVIGWADYEQKRQYVIDKVRAKAAGKLL